MTVRPSVFWLRAAAVLAIGSALPFLGASRGSAPGADDVTPPASTAAPERTARPGESPGHHGHARGSATKNPLIVAHRAGTADYPENTLEGIRGSLQDGADALWLTVQLSRDGIPVLYRPVDLAANTNGAGMVAEKTAAELTQLNAGWNFSPRGSTDTPYRSTPALLPTLAQALSEVPADVPLFLDLKQADPVPLADAVVTLLRRSGRVDHTVITSTDAAATGRAREAGDVQVAEDRDVTRARLLDIALAHRCDTPPAAGTWMAFEDRRTVTVSETFTLGTATTEVEVTPWDAEAVSCLDPKDRVNLMAIGVADAARYRELARLGVDALLVDSPREAATWATRSAH